MANVLYNGIDVSMYQQNVDYKKVKQDGYDFVIIRAGFGKYESQKDVEFEKHYANATAAGLFVGAYWYSYAKTAEEAKQEAIVCAKVLKGKQYSMPIYYDIEEPSVLALDRTTVDSIARTFCNYMESQKFFCGIYGGQHLFENLLTESTAKRYALWYAQYLKNPRYKGTYGLWQYSIAGDSAGNNPFNVPPVDGVKGLCDVDFCYVDYPKIIKQKKLNGYDEEPVPPEPKPEEYKPRLTKPEAGNPYYNTKSNGGYSNAIVGKPTDSGCNVLANCFTGDTKIITNKGAVRLDSLVDEEIEVLTADSRYRSAIGGYYGKQNIYEVTIGEHTYKATGNHRWVIYIDEDRTDIKSTEELSVGDKIPYVEISGTRKFDKVVSVKNLNQIVDVYCIEEPVTHTMVLESGLITGQCVGYAYGRFNEIGDYGYMKYLQPVNAERFIMNKGDLNVSQQPTLGGCMVWQKGATLDGSDGAGHVAIVEKINADGSIVTSESGYNCNKPFWTQTRVCGNGNWGADSSYKFLGCIMNPAVSGEPKPKEDESPYKEPTSVLKKGDSGEGVKWLQWHLNRLGYYVGDIDGKFEKVTLGALLAFQMENGLEVDGVCGPATRNAIKNS